MCGDRTVVEGVKVEELFEDDSANKAKEVDEIPMCTNCVAEVVVGDNGKVEEEHLIPMALDRVEQFDGGLSKRRWEAIHAGVATCGAGQLAQQHAEEGNDRAPSPIYVSMHDPLGQPAFRRSRTKPIPSWMKYLPNQRQDKSAETEPRPASILDDYFSPSESSVVDSDAEELPPQVAPDKVPVRPIPPTYTPVKMSRPFTLIAEEPVQRPSSKLGPGRLAPGKHVRFNNGNYSPKEPATTTPKAKTPSESSEFLEKYQQHPAASKTTVDLPSGTFGRTGNVSPSPWSRTASGIHKPASSSTTDTSHKWKPTTTASTDRPFLSDHQPDGTIGRKSQQQQQGVRSSYHERTYGFPRGGGFFAGGGDGVSDFGAGDCGGSGKQQQQQRRPVTFQDQLKRMFGFV